MKRFLYLSCLVASVTAYAEGGIIYPMDWAGHVTCIPREPTASGWLPGTGFIYVEPNPEDVARMCYPFQMAVPDHPDGSPRPWYDPATDSIIYHPVLPTPK